MTDGLDLAIHLLTAARDASLDHADARERGNGPSAGSMMLCFDAETIDALLLQLESARTYRDTLRRLHRHALRRNFALSAAGFVLGLIAVALNLRLWF